MIAALVSVVATAAVFVTFRETRRTANAAIKGVVEAARAAKAAEDALAETIQANATQLRPYLTFTYLGSEDVDKRLDFRVGGRFIIAVKNFGQTPARKAWIHRGHKLLSQPIGSAEVEFNELTEEIGQLAPGDHRNIVLYFAGFSDADIKSVRCGERAMMLRIKVEYEINDNGVRDADDITLVIYKRLLEMGPGIHRISSEHREAQ